MNAFRFPDTSGTIARLDLLGCDSEAVTNFIQHVGLSAQQIAFEPGGTVVCSIADMQPPLYGLEEPDQTVVDVVGTVRLTEGEIRQIETFVDELFDEYVNLSSSDWQQYTVRPHFQDSVGAESCRRFSCVGFVVEAYRAARIELVDTEPDRLPMVTLDSLLIAYPESEELRRPRIRQRMNLAGEGPWRILMPGHVFNAVASGADLRKSAYQATEGDEYFPSQAEAATDNQ